MRATTAHRTRWRKVWLVAMAGIGFADDPLDVPELALWAGLAGDVGAIVGLTILGVVWWFRRHKRADPSPSETRAERAEVAGPVRGSDGGRASDDYRMAARCSQGEDGRRGPPPKSSRKATQAMHDALNGLDEILQPDPNAMPENLWVEPDELPSLEQEPLSQEENRLIDHWIATESSSRAQARKHGRESLGMIARREIAQAHNDELLGRARGMPWWEAASAACPYLRD